MANQWLRLWHDMPNDPKWRTIARVSGQPISLVLSVYMHLLVEASRSVTRGHAHVTAEDLASALDVTEDGIEAVLNAMQGRVLDGQALTGWDKRQPKREDAGDPETGAKSASQRKREQRERERQAALERECHAESREVTTDKDKDKDKETPKPPSGESGWSRPDWVPADLWQQFEEVRRRKKKPLTDAARKLAVNRLDKLRAEGHDVATMLNDSILHAWDTFYAPKEGTLSKPANHWEGAI